MFDIFFSHNTDVGTKNAFDTPKVGHFSILYLKVKIPSILSRNFNFESALYYIYISKYKHINI